MRPVGVVIPKSQNPKSRASKSQRPKSQKSGIGSGRVGNRSHGAPSQRGGPRRTAKSAATPRVAPPLSESESQSEATQSADFDFQRLERVVHQLVEDRTRLVAENAALGEENRHHLMRLRSLEGQLLDANQKRQDVAKRVDELIAHLTQLDQHYASADQ